MQRPHSADPRAKKRIRRNFSVVTNRNQRTRRLGRPLSDITASPGTVVAPNAAGRRQTRLHRHQELSEGGVGGSPLRLAPRPLAMVAGYVSCVRLRRRQAGRGFLGRACPHAASTRQRPMSLTCLLNTELPPVANRDGRSLGAWEAPRRHCGSDGASGPE